MSIVLHPPRYAYGVATQIRLTELSHGAGCACKLPAGSLSQVLAGLPAAARPPQLLVGNESLDDAAVWRVSDELAVVTTIDFFTPLVDDPHTFGRIAATNAISDIYAMGAAPAYALNVVAFPKALPMELLGEILRGGAEVAEAAGVAIAGGHSIDDPEPKYGMAVTGFAHPDRIWTNTGGRPGHVLVFSKRIGTGIVATAIKREQAERSVVEAAGLRIDERIHSGAAHVTQSRTTRLFACGNAGRDHLGDVPAHDGREQRALVRKILVQRTHRDAGSLGDPRGRALIESVRQQDLNGGFENHVHGDRGAPLHRLFPGF